MPPVAVPGEVPAEFPFECDLDLSDGTKCTAQFRTKHSLFVHRAIFKQHQCVYLSTVLAVTNQCVSCKAILASRATCRNHMTASFRRGFCRKVFEKGSATVHEVQGTFPLDCLICGLKLYDADSARWHLPSHLPPSFALEL
eukprot:10732878-Heterocapsa_arctica.AAC.1